MILLLKCVGMEGRQAVMASDFAISRFKYLERLLLVHGHWNYDRLARMVLYFFYKNAVSKVWVKKNDTTSRHNCSTNIDPGAKNDKTRSKQNL